MDTQRVSQTIEMLDAWLETMRSQHGYCGPVTHWWQSCLLYCGPMMDWRYEGVICGYLNLYRVTSHPHWLDRAMTAGQDLLQAQLPNGKFRNSSFEAGPIEGGTPHEAAVDVALLELAKVLRSLGDSRWKAYYLSAEQNLEKYHFACLWNGTAFKDQAWNQTLVPNKNATVMEAMLLYEELSNLSVASYISGAANWILANQILEPGPRRGATVHVGTGRYRLTIGIYTARCVAALVRLYQRYPEEEYIQSARAMLPFLLSLVTDEGTQLGMYPNGQSITCPTWISASGDILRAFIVLRPYVYIPEVFIQRLVDMLARVQMPSGSIPTARGLGHKGRVHFREGHPDFRDVLPVVGWCDKAFRALTLLEGLNVKADGVMLGDATIECTWKDRECIFQETVESMRLTDSHRNEVIYDWRKGEHYPRLYKL